MIYNIVLGITYRTEDKIYIIDTDSIVDFYEVGVGKTKKEAIKRFERHLCEFVKNKNYVIEIRQAKREIKNYKLIIGEQI